MTRPLRTPTPASYADVERVPPHLVAELVDGALETHPRPSPRHAAASAELIGALRDPFRRGVGGPGGWVFMDEPELHLAEHVVVPDIAGWRRERLLALPETPWLETPPDWVCEILSPSTARLDQGPKRRIYAEHGVPFLWLLDPATRVLDAFQLVGGKWRLEGTAAGSETVSLPPFDAISFPLDSLFPFDPPVAD